MQDFSLEEIGKRSMFLHGNGQKLGSHISTESSSRRVDGGGEIEMNHTLSKSRELQKVESSSTWPSIPKPSILPKYNHIFTLFAALLLSTTLALFSALDAAINCTRETNVWSLPWFDHWYAYEEDTYEYEYYDYNNRNLEDEQGQNDNDYYEYADNNQNDDDGFISTFSEAENCKYLFTSAILPVCPLVVILCSVACRWTFNSKEWKKEAATDREIPQSISFSGEKDNDMARFAEFKAHVDHQMFHLRSCYKLFSISILCMGLWLYAMIMIAHESDIPLLDDEEENNLFTLQFQSLGSITYVGEVGQNANLYYSSWFSLMLSVALLYELGRITYTHYWVTQHLEIELARITRYRATQTNAVEMIMTWSKSQQQVIKDKRSAWHESLYKLRSRTGMWLTTLIASSIIYLSSQRVWNNSIYPAAVANGEVGDDGVVCTIVHGYISFKSLDDLGLIHPSECEVTRAARATGILCMALATFALLAHYHMHRLVAKEIKSSSKLLRNREDFRQILEKRQKLIPLRLECLFSAIISVVLAINALFATGVEGPASKVGNLYYSSWIAFISSMRLTLNCLEDILVEDEESVENDAADDLWSDNGQSFQGKNRKRRPTMSRLFSINTNFTMKEKVSTRLIMLAPTQSSEKDGDDDTIGSYIGGMPIPKKNSFYQMFEERVVEEEEASRAKRARRWASGCIFSSIYLIAVLDAAFHKSYGELDLVQLYMVICPCIVTAFSLIMFFMCLNPSTYHMVDDFRVGGILSLFLLFIWVWNLIFTLHNESSWAVNEIGEVKMANLYYFTWLTVMNKGVLMSSYVKRYFNVKQKSFMVVLWVAVIKICFVMFGSCCDILLSIRDQCLASEHGDATATFCERTLAGAVLGFVGMAAGFFAAIFRFQFPFPALKALKIEAAMAATLTLLFAFSLALITGIGGPGQSVGDLYYGSWLAFLASLGVTSSLYSELNKGESCDDSLGDPMNHADATKQTEGSTPYVFMRNNRKVGSHGLGESNKI